MPIRITGMNSGLDTESIITALTQKKKDKVDTFTGDQKKLTWKQDKWKELNKKVVSFYNGTLSNMRFASAYVKKTTTSSNANAATVITGDSAMNTTQSLDITKLAKAAYLTGKELKTVGENGKRPTMSTTMEELGAATGEEGGQLKFKIGGSESHEYITVDIAASDTIENVLSKLRSTKSIDETTGLSTGKTLNANFDEGTGRFYISSKEMGEANSFSMESTNAMTKLGLVEETIEGKSNYQAGSSAEIYLNGVKYESNSNTFQINGLTITANQVASDITLTTKQDTSGIYDNIKKMIKEYNDLMKEFATLYNADPAKKYKMLTDDQKDQMSDKEVEEWEKKIKEGLLSKDETIGNVRNALKEIMNQSFEITDKNGKTSKFSLASFGISTGSYFSTEDNERDVFHIDGDADDSVSSGNTDLLSGMIANDPDTVQSFFSELSKTLYNKLFDMMKGTQYSSAFTIYEDKLMASQYSAYNTKISDAQKALEAAQDKYYKKFSVMETALSKINSSSSSLANFFGGGQ
ncbi:flagellar filament capping protein FliD [Butyrivibrio sp. INlla21]|uniref:flagellar filament capping protein FliD n=1 Tax=Butyrivibrio sp. INlla21 TaxID=1520811 RepID=UPI0008F1DA20|nr:flagellar filament capping protein FliD [Butyrivibrio sp. INlla21]MBR4669462.1 flagellar filament capping protein FliD [Butyrivibrio sp.]SFU66217.1 flagellar hook-associated protein 2 [Butyrivibrio sp. INlla21]